MKSSSDVALMKEIEDVLNELANGEMIFKVDGNCAHVAASISSPASKKVTVTLPVAINMLFNKLKADMDFEMNTSENVNKQFTSEIQISNNLEECQSYFSRFGLVLKQNTKEDFEEDYEDEWGNKFIGHSHTYKLNTFSLYANNGAYVHGLKIKINSATQQCSLIADALLETLFNNIQIVM